MWNDIVHVLLDFKYIILLAVAAGIIIAAIATRLAYDLKFDQRRWKFLGIFAGLRANEILWMAFLAARYAFIAAVVAFNLKLTLAYHGCYALLCLGCMLLIPRAKRAALDFVNSVVVYAALMVTNMMHSSLTERQFDQFIFIITLLLAVFLIVYATYFLLKDLAEMLRDRKRQEVSK